MIHSFIYFTAPLSRFPYFKSVEQSGVNGNVDLWVTHKMIQNWLKNDSQFKSIFDSKIDTVHSVLMNISIITLALKHNIVCVMYVMLC